jgi:predicted ATP-grasp superfamily ATP-dependent carboligase
MNTIELMLTKANYLKVKKLIQGTTQNNLKIVNEIEGMIGVDIVLQYDKIDLLLIQLIQRMPNV